MRFPYKFLAGAVIGVLVGVGVARAPWPGADLAPENTRSAGENRHAASPASTSSSRSGASSGPRAGRPSAEKAPRRGRPQNAGSRGRGRTPAVTFAAATTATINRTIDAIGTARSVKSVTLTAEVSGVVESVAFKPGEAVAAGDVLIQIQDDAQEIALARARAQFPIARENAERFAALSRQDAASAIEAETAFNALKTLEADMKAAAFAVAQRRVTAPFDGVPGLTQIEPGDYVSVGNILTTLDDDAALVVEFLIPQEAASGVSIGQAITATPVGEAGQKHAGVITAIDSRIDAASRTLRVEGAIANDDRRLKPGVTLAVTTTQQGAPAVSVPGLAVQWDRQGPYVWRLDGDGVATQARVTIRQRSDDVILVDGDIAAESILIAEGADRVRPGMRFEGAPVGGGKDAIQRRNKTQETGNAATTKSVGAGGGVSAAN